jgi:hypothetical protein
MPNETLRRETARTVMQQGTSPAVLVALAIGIALAVLDVVYELIAKKGDEP